MVGGGGVGGKSINLVDKWKCEKTTLSFSQVATFSKILTTIEGLFMTVAKTLTTCDGLRGDWRGNVLGSRKRNHLGHSTEIEPTLRFVSNFINWLFIL